MESDLSDLFPAPFPDNVPTIELPKISLNKLLNEDPGELEKIFKICTRTGFFYLNMMDHPKGKKMYEDACLCCRIGMETLPNLPMEEKNKYPIRDRHGVFDRGYARKQMRSVYALIALRLDLGADISEMMDNQSTVSL